MPLLLILPALLLLMPLHQPIPLPPHHQYHCRCTIQYHCRRTNQYHCRRTNHYYCRCSYYYHCRRTNHYHCRRTSHYHCRRTTTTTTLAPPTTTAAPTTTTAAPTTTTAGTKLNQTCDCEPNFREVDNLDFTPLSDIIVCVGQKQNNKCPFYDRKKKRVVIQMKLNVQILISDPCCGANCAEGTSCKLCSSFGNDDENSCKGNEILKIDTSVGVEGFTNMDESYQCNCEAIDYCALKDSMSVKMTNCT